ncbi:DMT family transporter [Oceanospirillum sediminis]|uniref:DMT family transporter n=1 Tax=Oceanospirillum sediminis TaxID=2760088 RepID=A0A839IIP6_9GAMM|nr:DMT family transporter [Oceanospirillum sediminis]MBB1485203.1 DMT family transporter [Oceanospirillum sediminis]
MFHAFSESGEKQALIYALSAVAMWSTVATAFKVALGYLSPEQLLLWAALFSALVLTFVISWQKKWHHLKSLSSSQLRASVLYGLFNPGIYYLVLFAAYDRLPAQEAQALNYTWALTLTFLAVPFLGQKLRRQDILAGVICYGGVLVIATRGQLLSLEFGDLTGVSLALFSTLIWAGYWIANTRDQREPVIGLWLNFLFALPFLLLVNLWYSSLHWPEWQGIAAAMYVGIFEMGLAFVCWLQAMRLTRHTARISNLIFLSPVISLVLIYTILDENIYISTLAGLVMILAGLWVQQRKMRQPDQSE